MYRVRLNATWKGSSALAYETCAGDCLHRYRPYWVYR
jgi:hypothetical protein